MAALPVRRGGRNTSLVNPTREFEDIYDRMGQLMNFAFGDMARVEMPWVPLADLSETEDAYVAKVELPGVGKDQIDVQLQDRELVVSGEIPEQEQEQDGQNGGRRAPQHAPHRPVRVPRLAARRRERRRGTGRAHRRGTDADHPEVRGRQAPQDRDQGLTRRLLRAPGAAHRAGSARPRMTPHLRR